VVPTRRSLPFPSGTDAGARARTWDRLVNSEALYHLSYSGARLAVQPLGD
jgi:hypothetical protein